MSESAEKDPWYFDKDARPLFVIGAPRSGTTLLVHLLNAHPNILITDELRAAAWLHREAKKMPNGFNEHGNPYPFNHGREFSEYLLGNAGSLLRPFYVRMAKEDGKNQLKYWGDKYPHYHSILKDMARMFPRAHFVMIHRELREVALSVMRGHNWSLSDSAQYVKRIYSEYMDKIDALDGRILHIDYASLTDDPANVIGSVFSRLGLRTTSEVSEAVTETAKLHAHSIRKGKGSAQKHRKVETTKKRWMAAHADELEKGESELKELDELIRARKAEVEMVGERGFK